MLVPAAGAHWLVSLKSRRSSSAPWCSLNGGAFHLVSVTQGTVLDARDRLPVLAIATAGKRSPSSASPTRGHMVQSFGIGGASGSWARSASRLASHRSGSFSLPRAHR